MTKSQRAQKLVEEGQWQILRGDYMRAIDSCSRALDIRDDWAPAFLCRSEARLMTRDPLANIDAQQALKLDPKSGEPLRLLGIMEFQAGQYKLALDRFNEALKRSKLKPEGVTDIYYYRARAYVSLGDLEQALKDTDRGIGVLQGLNADFSDWSFYSLRAEILRLLGKNDKADADERRVIDSINTRMKRRPMETVGLMHQRAESYARLREYDKSIADYGSILSRSTDDVKTMLDRAQALSYAGRHEEAIKDLDLALKLDPGRAGAQKLRALERVSLGDYFGALRDLDAYLTQQPNDAVALAYRGISKRYLEDWRGALDDINRAQELRPYDRSLWGHKAYVQAMAGEHAGALESADKALAADPEDRYAHEARGHAGLFLGRCQDVAPSLDWLVAHSSGSSRYLWLRGECRCSIGGFTNGLEDLQRAATFDPGSSVFANSLALQHRRYLNQFPFHVNLQELRRSQLYFDRAGALGSLEPPYRLGRARTLLEFGQQLVNPGSAAERARLWRQALTEVDAVLRKEPKNQDARELRRQLRRKLAPPRGSKQH